MITIVCENCGMRTPAPDADDGWSAKCPHCGGTFVVQQPAAAPSGGAGKSTGPKPRTAGSSAGGPAKGTPSIPCKVCDQGDMQRTSQYRLGGVAGVIGTVITAVSVIAIGVLLVLVVVGAPFGGGLPGHAIFGILALTWVGGWLIPLLTLQIGLVLRLRRTVLRCSMCGATVEAS